MAMCIATGLVGGEAFSIDASLIKADVDKKKRMPGDQPIAWPNAEEASVREYLAALDIARGDEDGGGDAGGAGKGGDRHKSPKEVSLTDPQATWVARPGLDPFFAWLHQTGLSLFFSSTRIWRTGLSPLLVARCVLRSSAASLT